MLLDDRDADFLGGAGIDGGFEDHDGAALQVAADRFAGAEQRSEVRLVRVIDRRRNGDHDKVGLAQLRGVRGDGKQRGCLQVIRADFARRIDELAVGVDLLHGKIEADGPEMLAELDGERKSDVT